MEKLVPPQRLVRELRLHGKTYHYYSLDAAREAGMGDVRRLPYTLKIIFENLLRQYATNAAEAAAGSADEIAAVAHWRGGQQPEREIGFKPARVMMVDSSGIPLLGDMAAMRDAMLRLGGDPARINPAVPVDFIVDHSAIVDHSGAPDALARNISLEFQRNRERYAFLKWGARAFDKLRLIPPGTGICHQINLEYLARVVWTAPVGDKLFAYPDSVLGMDSHTPMINGIGVLGWGVGGLEGGTAALGEPVSLLIPEVVGCRLVGQVRAGVSATDVVLSITQALRRERLVGSFVEYFGPGLASLSAFDRATIANMTPEFGATMGYFPIDAETLRFLRITGRDAEQVALVEAYAKTQGLWRAEDDAIPDYSRVLTIDLAAVEASIAGPRRPHERLALSQAPAAFRSAFAAFPAQPAAARTNGIRAGDIIIAAITSCTNTANPGLMLATGLLARNAARRGLRPPPWVKTSLSPGSRVVTDYLAHSGLLPFLEQLGFGVAGYGCMTCIGNSGPIDAAIAAQIAQDDIAAVAVLSGNRNFEGRIHPRARANFLASPPLVLAYALAGSILTDLDADPLGHDDAGNPVHLREIWPDQAEIQELLATHVTPAAFGARYVAPDDGPPDWRAIAAADGATFAWKSSSFILRPPFFDTLSPQPQPPQDIFQARILAMFGDMLTTDHISPIGAITPGTAAAQYLQAQGVAPGEFVSYGARRLNHHVMTRGTFANIRIRNEMVEGVEGGYTRHVREDGPDPAIVSIFDAAERYRAEGVPVVVVAGSDYGAGSSRDWAAKGTRLLGVRAVIAESFERIHRSNLVGIGVLPLQFEAGVSRKTLGLDGSERIDVIGLEQATQPRATLTGVIHYADGRRHAIKLTARLDTRQEVAYYLHGGILHYALRQRLPGTANAGNADNAAQ